LSAVTLWIPPGRGTYQLRHVLLGVNGSRDQIYPEIFTLVVS
jgi:hypothetical protein